MEHLIHSLKRVAGLEPLRVWKEDSIGDAILSALLAETTIAMAGYEMEAREETNVRKGRGYGRGCRHPTGFMVWSLDHSTVTRSIEKGRVKKAHSSNQGPISKEVFSNIAADIGRRRVVSAWIPQVFRTQEVDFQDDAIVWAIDPINWRMDKS